MRVHVVLEVRAAEHQLLALVVKCQLAHVDQTRARQVGPNAAPEASNATLLGVDVPKSVRHARVAPPLLWQPRVRLHAHLDEVCWAGDELPRHPRRETDRRLLPQRQRARPFTASALARQAVAQLLIEHYARGRVYQVPHHACAHARVKPQHALGRYNLPRHAQCREAGGGCCWRGGVGCGGGSSAGRRGGGGRDGRCCTCGCPCCCCRLALQLQARLDGVEGEGARL